MASPPTAISPMTPAFQTREGCWLGTAELATRPAEFTYRSVSDTVLYVNPATGAPRLTRAEKRARTRAALVDAAGRVFLERGFLGASVEAIAAEAGYTRGAFYSNFSTKEEIFAELLHQRVYSTYRQMAV